jgi:host factor-I protein
MKTSSDAAAVGRAPEREEFVNRKLIRPQLNRPVAPPPGQSVSSDGAAVAPAPEKPARQRAERPANGKHQPSEQTHAENFYYQKQMQSRTQMTILLQTGETIQGTIEWYDKNCIKVHRAGKPNLLIYKPAIRYMHKSNE